MGTRLKALGALMLAASLAGSPPAFAAVPEPGGAPYDPVGKRMGDHVLVDQDGGSFHLKELLGRPVVISYVYAACPHVCPTTLTSLKNAFDSSGGLGRDFTALTVDFDPENASPGALKAFGSKFTDDFGKWRFATSDKLTIAGMANETGLYYERGQNGRDFTHSSMVTVLDGGGRIAANLYGAEVDAAKLKAAVRAAAEGRSFAGGSQGMPVQVRPGAEGIMDRLWLLCYTYDEASGGYRVKWSGVGALAAVFSIHTAILVLIARMVFSRRRAAGQPRP